MNGIEMLLESKNPRLDKRPIMVDTSKGLAIPPEDIINFWINRTPTEADYKAIERIKAVNLTPHINSRIESYGMTNCEGKVEIYLHNTTAFLVKNEFENKFLGDISYLLLERVPTGRHYGHDDFLSRTEFRKDGKPERQNGWAHAAAYDKPDMLSAIVCDGKLLLGTWQNIILVDLDANPNPDVTPKQIREIYLLNYLSAPKKTL